MAATIFLRPPSVSFIRESTPASDGQPSGDLHGLSAPLVSYGGFSFVLVDPWPGNWAQNWYATDDVHIGYDNRYYLYDRSYPGVGLAITVAL